MPNWKELGEVPDSEEEDDGFDSQDLGAPPPSGNVFINSNQQHIWDVPDSSPEAEPPSLPRSSPGNKAVPVTALATIDGLNSQELGTAFTQPPPTHARIDLSRQDIWDIPESSAEDELPPLPAPLSSRKVTAIPAPATTNIFSSSPLSSVASDQDLPSINRLIGTRNDDEIPDADGPNENTLQRRQEGPKPSAAVPRPSPEAANRTTQPHTTEVDQASVEARQVAVRQERSLRPRKPIQEHPYLIENANYSTFLRQHGVRPLRIAAEEDRRRRQETTIDEEFRDESQESGRPELSQDVQSGILEDEDSQSQANTARAHLPVVLSSSPLRTSPRNDGRASSPVTPPGGSDNTSLLDHDLPDIDELLKQPPPNKVKPSRRRPVSPSESSARKKRKGVTAREDSTRTPNVPAWSLSDPLVTPPRLVLRNTSPNPVSVATGSPESVNLSPQQPTAALTDGESDTPQNHAEDGSDGGFLEDDGEASDSSTEVDAALARRLRRVLPASWLRLDQKAGREKVQQDVKTKQRKRAPELEQRRGVAQKRHAPTTPTAAPIFFDESDDEDEPRPPPKMITDHFEAQTTHVLQPIHNLDTPQEVDSDDDLILMEEDFIDDMRPGRKRQLKLSESFLPKGKRVRQTPIPARAMPSTLSKQSSTAPVVTQARAKSRSEGQAKTKDNRKRNRQQKVLARGKTPAKPIKARVSTLPKLSILDVIEPNAPRFLSIAARTARKRRDQGRSSPRKKSIRLATRRDHVDAASVLHDWRAGSIRQRSSVTERVGQPACSNHSSRKPSASTGRAAKVLLGLVRAGRSNVQSLASNADPRVGSGGSSAREPLVSSTPRNNQKSTKRASSGAIRQAQLESDPIASENRPVFHSVKRHLDRQYQHNHQGTPRSVTEVPSDPGEAVLDRATPLQSDQRQLHAEKVTLNPRNARIRKRTKPQRIDLQAPEYTQAHDPLTINPTPEIIDYPKEETEGRLLGLGPYGVHYTYHFEIFPLPRGVYFHECTLIGQGVIEAIQANDTHSYLATTRQRISFSMGDKALRWGSWTEQVSSELGIAFDWILEQLNGLAGVSSEQEVHPITRAATSILDYLRNSISFVDEAQMKTFVVRFYEILTHFNQRMSLCSTKPEQDAYSLELKVYDRMLLAVLLVMRMCEGSTLLAQECFQLQELLKGCAKTQTSRLMQSDANRLRKTYEQLGITQVRERGLRDDEVVVHSWVILLRTLELAKIPRSSFWDILQMIIAPPEVLAAANANELENIWETLFTLLPLVEFNDTGVVIPGRRHYALIESWALPQKMLRHVFQLYEKNARQAASFNSYCKALVARCHYLVDQWGWRRPIAIIGLIFDFFGSQGLGHLRNEEVYASPKFLDQLGHNPRLSINPEDRCFHVFLKLLALSIHKLKDVDAVKDIRNLVARTLPNHSRQYEKEHNILERDLAALRNHHDLLCTLFWAAPPDLRPAPTLLKDLVDPAASHKEATLINLRAWSQLARFIAAAGEGKKSFQPFAEWRDAYFQQILSLFDGVESDINRQYLSLPKDVVQSIDAYMVQAMVSTNKKAVLDILYFSLTASLDVLKQTRDLGSAIPIFNSAQLQQVFQHFAFSPPQLDWGILRQSLASLDVFLSMIDEFMDSESQQSESMFMNHTEADDALALLDSSIAKGFFSMARGMLSVRGGKRPDSLANADAQNCVEMTVEISARFSAKLLRGAFMRPCQLFKAGTYGLFDDVPSKLGMEHRQHLVLFMTTILKHGFDDFTDAGFSLQELWASSIVKPKAFLRFEHQLAEQLIHRKKDFVPAAIIGLATQPDYKGNRDLFEHMVSKMRSSINAAGPSIKKTLISEHAKVLRGVMDQLKGDLKLVAQQGVGHHEYVLFVRDIIAKIRALGSDICSVDEYFYQISKEYSPPEQDPQLQVPAMIAYGIRLAEGEARAAHQMFFLLLNNFKASLISNSLGEQSRMLHRAMKDRRVLRFVLGHMLPAIIRTRNVSALPLLDVYVEALRLLVDTGSFPQELAKDDLSQLAVTTLASVDLIQSLIKDDKPLSPDNVHVVSQLYAIFNLTWPSIYVLKLSQANGDTNRPEGCLEAMSRFATSIQAYLEQRLRAQEQAQVQECGLVPAQLLFGQSESSEAFFLHASSPVVEFAGHLNADIEKNWVISDERVLIQAPGKARDMTSTQSKDGVEWPKLPMRWFLRTLLQRVLEFRRWWDRVYGFETQRRCTKQDMKLFF